MAQRLIRIVPLVRMPRSLGFFDYTLPDGMDAEVGNAVSAPFRGRVMTGLVVAKPKESDVSASRIKPILDVLDAPAIGKPVVDAMMAIAEESLTSPATTVFSLLPKMPKRKTAPLPERTDSFAAPEPEGREPALWHDALQDGPSLFAYDDDAERGRFLDTAVLHAHASGRPLLFIAPRVSLARTFGRPFGDRATVITGQGAMTARWEAWREAERADIVAGTALALFTPHTRPFAIVVDDEDASEHLHGDAAPRYDVRKAAERVAEGWGCPVIFLSRTPTVASWHRLGTSMRLIPSENRLKTRTVICDFGDEFRSKRFNPVTESLLTGLDTALGEKKRGILVVNRKGDAARLVCRDCRLTASCGTCGTALAVHGAKLVCPRCRKEEPVPDTCPGCNGARLSGSGAGIERIAEFLQNRHPESSIRTYTKESHEASALTADIVLGTEYMMTHARERLLADRRIGFIGTLSADTFLVRLSDAMTEEREYRRLRRLALLAASHGLPVHLQTSEPELPLYAMLATESEKWYRLELEDRKIAGIHPYQAVARLVASSSEHDKLKIEAEKLAGLLKQERLFSIFEVRIIRSGPRNKAWIGLTFPPGKEKEVRETVRPHLPESWGYDPAPFEPVN